MLDQEKNCDDNFTCSFGVKTHAIHKIVRKQKFNNNILSYSTKQIEVVFYKRATKDARPKIKTKTVSNH